MINISDGIDNIIRYKYLQNQNLKYFPISKLKFQPHQGCVRLRFFGLTRLWLMWQFRWFDSDSTLHFSRLTQFRLNLNPKVGNLNSDSTYLSQSWVKADSRLITFYLILPKVERGEGVRSNVALGWLFPRNATYKAQKRTALSTWNLADLLIQQFDIVCDFFFWNPSEFFFEIWSILWRHYTPLLVENWPNFAGLWKT